MVTQHWGGTATALSSGQVLIEAGGGEAGGATSPELYDPSNGRFTAIAVTTEPRMFATATLLADGRVLIAGGGSGPVELYDPVTGRFTQGPSLTVPRKRATATLLSNGQVLIAAGFADTSLSSAELFG
jgi:hypothetical protein